MICEALFTYKMQQINLKLLHFPQIFLRVGGEGHAP